VEGALFAYHRSKAALLCKVHHNVDASWSAEHVGHSNAVGMTHRPNDGQLAAHILVNARKQGLILDGRHLDCVRFAIFVRLVDVRLTASVDAIEANVATFTKDVVRLGCSIAVGHRATVERELAVVVEEDFKYNTLENLSSVDNL